jgi:membrane protein
MTSETGQTKRRPEKPTDLGPRSWWNTLKRTAIEFKDDGLTDWAAALTYYGILAIFPALLALVGILGLIGTSATQPILDNLGQFVSGTPRDVAETAVRNVQEGQGGGIIATVIGVLVAVFQMGAHGTFRLII